MQVCFSQTVYAEERDSLTYIYLRLVKYNSTLLTPCQTNVFVNFVRSKQYKELLWFGQYDDICRLTSGECSSYGYKICKYLMPNKIFVLVCSILR